MVEQGYVQKFIKSVQARLALWVALQGFLFVLLEWTLNTFLEIDGLIIAAILSVIWLIVAIGVGIWLGKSITKPTQYIAQSILHISPTEHLVPPPKSDDLKFGRELTDTLTRQIYNFATVANQGSEQNAPSNSAGLIDQLPVAIIGIDEKGNIALANKKATSITGRDTIVGQPIINILSFITDDVALEQWLSETRQKNVTGTKIWQKAELKAIDNTSLGYFDIAVSFNARSSSGLEVIIALNDHSEAYTQETDSISFMALAVHEMRTPLTIMRGYVEALKDDLGDKITPQSSADLEKLIVSSESLSSFVSKILNVARINQGELALNLEQNNWNTVLPKIVDGLRNRASVYGKEIELRMQPGLPPVAIDRMTIGEVITNLVDNAIKYSPDNAKQIRIISKLNKDGQIETVVQDKGVGIPSSVMPHLFSKFQRNYRNSKQIGGTGLGLFLSKSIISAHNGNIWANSQEGQGSTFGFTLLPFSQLAKDQQTNNNEEIIRSSHGWIKNHSMQRR